MLWRPTLLLLLAATAGCASFGSRSVSDEKMLAARELCRLGQSAWESSRWGEAHARFARAVELCPQHVESRRHYARAMWQRGDRAEALAQMRRVVEETAGEPVVTTELGRMLFEQGEYNEAAACVQLALNSDPRMADALVLRADIYRTGGHLQEALDDYHRARSFGCQEPRVLIAMAELHLETGRPDRALATLDHLRDVTVPHELHVRQLVLAGTAFQALGRHDDAIERLELARKSAPRDSDLLMRLGEAYLAAGRRQESEATLASMMALVPQDQPTR